MSDFILVMPEILLVLTLASVIAAEITYHGEEYRMVAATALMGLLGALIQTVLLYKSEAKLLFYGALSIDGFSLFFKLLFIFLAIVSIIASTRSKELPPSRRTEFYTLVLASTLAECIAASVADLLLAFLSLLLINVMSYFLAGFGKRSLGSIEASAKFMVVASAAAGLLLYGMAILFAVTHSFNIYEIHKQLLMGDVGYVRMLVIFLLFFLAFCFQFGAFPMHLHAPDVLDGAPTPVASFLAVGTRAAGFAIAIRFMISGFSQAKIDPGQWQVLGNFDWTRVIALISGCTMIYGALLAFRQRRAKRMVGCLVVAQSGQYLMGFLVLDQVGISALLYNLVVELLSVVGVFYVLGYLLDEFESDEPGVLKGILSRSVPECICLIIFLACLVGLPPTPGFIGKFTLIGSVLRHQRPLLALTAILSMTLSTVAIARLAYLLVGDFSIRQDAGWVGAEAIGPRTFRRGFLVALILPLLVTGVFAETIFNWTGRSLGFIFW